MKPFPVRPVGSPAPKTIWFKTTTLKHGDEGGYQMSCKCAEMDWTDVDQTAEHHPACETQCGKNAVANAAMAQPAADVSMKHQRIRVTFPACDTLADLTKPLVGLPPRLEVVGEPGAGSFNGSYSVFLSGPNGRSPLSNVVCPKRQGLRIENLQMTEGTVEMSRAGFGAIGPWFRWCDFKVEHLGDSFELALDEDLRAGLTAPLARVGEFHRALAEHPSFISDAALARYRIPPMPDNLIQVYMKRSPLRGDDRSPRDYAVWIDKADLERLKIDGYNLLRTPDGKIYIP